MCAAAAAAFLFHVMERRRNPVHFPQRLDDQRSHRRRRKTALERTVDEIFQRYFRAEYNHP